METPWQNISFRQELLAIHGIRARLVKNGTNKKVHEFIYPTLHPDLTLALLYQFTGFIGSRPASG
jgi:hypothetical protein